MHIPDLPTTYASWLPDRQRHLENNLVLSEYTKKLFQRYREELGDWRYNLLLQAQSLLVPEQVSSRLSLPEKPLLASTLWLYGVLNTLKLRSLMQRILLPPKYLTQVRDLDKAA